MAFCGPYLHANQLGFWLYSPVDVDLYLDDRGIWRIEAEPYENLETPIIQANLDQGDTPEGFDCFSRQKIETGKVEEDIVQIWTGLILHTPKGWGIHVRQPINMNEEIPYRIQEGIIESDWMSYDIWINVRLTQRNTTVSFRKDGDPLAQLVPVRREAYQAEWALEDRMLLGKDEESRKVFAAWKEYNYRKWIAMGQKDPRTYHKTRKRAIEEKDST